MKTTIIVVDMMTHQAIPVLYSDYNLDYHFLDTEKSPNRLVSTYLLGTALD